jgi:phage head maturation protease
MMTGIYDFTLAADPAYPDTHCEAEARELVSTLREKREDKSQEKIREQVRAMRSAASRTIV